MVLAGLSVIMVVLQLDQEPQLNELPERKGQRTRGTNSSPCKAWATVSFGMLSGGKCMPQISRTTCTLSSV